MRRVIFLFLLAGLFAAVAGGGTPASAGALPSAATPNAPGSIRIPSPISRYPTVPEARSYQQLLALWQQAGAAYGVPWQVLGAINKIESDFGRNMGPSSAGAVGWMQFMPSTWERWGLDANGDGLANPWNPEDAVYAAARYLAAAGAHDDISRAIFAYNHAQWYVDQVLEVAQAFGGDGSGFVGELGTGLLYGSASVPGVGAPLVFRIDDIEKRLAAARKRVARARQAIVVEEKQVEKLDWATTAAEQRAGNPNLGDDDFQAVERRVTELAVERDRVGVAITRLQERLDYEISRLDELRKEAEVEASAMTRTRITIIRLPTSPPLKAPRSSRMRTRSSPTRGPRRQGAAASGWNYASKTAEALSTATCRIWSPTSCRALHLPPVRRSGWWARPGTQPAPTSICSSRQPPPTHRTRRGSSPSPGWRTPGRTHRLRKRPRLRVRRSSALLTPSSATFTRSRQQHLPRIADLT